MNNYEERKVARIERLRERADRKEAEAASRGKRVETMAGIMNGQPILIGHHSEKRHRRDIARMNSNMRASVEASDAAQRLRGRADAAEDSRVISSDDPAAPDKLVARIAMLENKRDAMKATNAAFKRGQRVSDTQGWLEVSKVVGEDAALALCTQMTRLSYKAPFPAYEFTNIGANIRRLKGRVQTTKSEAARQPARPERCEGFAIEERVDDNRIALVFDDKPSSETRALLKLHGFRWSPTNSAWQRQLNASGRAAAQAVRSLLSTEFSIAKGE